MERKMPDALLRRTRPSPTSHKSLVGWFDHGLGDCVHFAFLLQLYRRRGYGPICIHFEENKRPVFEAAGCQYSPAHINYHHWRYDPGFNQPDPHHEGSGNKLYYNLNSEWLPYIGDPDDLWRELIEVNLEDAFDGLITEPVREDVRKFLEHLPRPIVLLHTKGTNIPQDKNIPDEVTSQLYALMLNGMPGSIVLLDWDFRIPTPSHGRMRHIKRDWGHISVLELAALISEVDLLIGVDSGPWHLSNMTRTPALGVFHNFFPWCVSLPRVTLKSAVLTRDSHHHATIHRRKVWNALEYPAPMPKAPDIAKHALRMLAGPRYGCPIGRDVMLQHLILDFLSASTSTSVIADRNNTMDVLFREMARFPNPTVVETGCVRAEEDWTAGYFGYICGAWLDGRKVGKLTSVDVDSHHCAIARELCKPWGRVEVVDSDSVTYLEMRTEPIDVLYLDSLDCERPDHADHGLREAQAGERLVSNGGLVVVDDTVYSAGWTGKGAKAVPYLLRKGWKLIGCGYQAILRK
jgi:hypothetical protein